MTICDQLVTLPHLVEDTVVGRAGRRRLLLRHHGDLVSVDGLDGDAAVVILPHTQVHRAAGALPDGGITVGLRGLWDV